MPRRVRSLVRTGCHLCVVAFATLLAGGCSGTTIGSVGAVLSRDAQTGVVIVREVPEELAGAEAGMEPGDRIKMIDGIHVDDLDRRRVTALLRGPVGSSVRLTVLRAGEVIHLDVVRGAFSDQPVSGRQQTLRE